MNINIVRVNLTICFILSVSWKTHIHTYTHKDQEKREEKMEETMTNWVHFFVYINMYETRKKEEKRGGRNRMKRIYDPVC